MTFTESVCRGAGGRVDGGLAAFALRLGQRLFLVAVGKTPTFWVINCPVRSPCRLTKIYQAVAPVKREYLLDFLEVQHEGLCSRGAKGP